MKGNSERSLLMLMEGRVRLYLNIDSPASIKLAEKQQIP